MKVPNDDISLKAHEGPLTAGDIPAIWRDFDDRHFVVVTSEECLFPREDVPDDNGGAKRIDEMFVVGVKDECIFGGA